MEMQCSLLRACADARNLCTQPLLETLNCRSKKMTIPRASFLSSRHPCMKYANQNASLSTVANAPLCDWTHVSKKNRFQQGSCLTNPNIVRQGSRVRPWGGLEAWDLQQVAAQDSTRCKAALQDAGNEELYHGRAEVIDGKAIAAQIRREVAVGVEVLRAAVGKVPGLAVVLVGNRKDSEAYVRSKKKACVEVGIESFGADLPEDASEDDVVAVVEAFNADPRVHGVLVQLPLPKHMNEERVVESVSIHKDVDGFHPTSMGRLAMQGREPLFVPCTPRGCLELLLRSDIQIDGKHAVVIGRSNVVGTPAALLLQRHNATVSIVHSRTPNPAEVTRRADIVIAAAGRANLVRGDWIKPGAAVIDVGINPVEDLSTKRGYRLVGDVCYEEVSKVASAITPVPGGVGPMTIAMLLQNTLLSAQRTFSVDV